MADYAKIARALTDALRPVLPPIAVAITDDLPQGVAAFSGRVPSGCTFWSRAATETFATTAGDHDLCGLGGHVLNFPKTEAAEADFKLFLRVTDDLGYLRPEDLPAIPVLRTQPKHVVYAPLANAPLAPDVALLFVKPEQALLFSEAAQQIEGAGPALGRPACGVIPQAANTGRGAVSFGSCGARAYVDAFARDVTVCAIAGAKLDAYAERLTVLAKANTVLGLFHKVRRSEVDKGKTPSIKDSLAALPTRSS